MKWLCATLSMLLLFTQTAHAQQTATEPQARRLFDAANAEFRDGQARAWIVIDLDPAGSPDFGSFLVPALPQATPGAMGELAGVDGHDGPWLVLAIDLSFDLARGMVSEIRAAPAGSGGSALGLGGLL